MGAQKNRLIEMVLLSTHNICFGLEMYKKINFQLCTLNWRPDVALWKIPLALKELKKDVDTYMIKCHFHY